MSLRRNTSWELCSQKPVYALLHRYRDAGCTSCICQRKCYTAAMSKKKSEDCLQLHEHLIQSYTDVAACVTRSLNTDVWQRAYMLTFACTKADASMLRMLKPLPAET